MLFSYKFNISKLNSQYKSVVANKTLQIRYAKSWLAYCVMIYPKKCLRQYFTKSVYRILFIIHNSNDLNFFKLNFKKKKSLKALWFMDQHIQDQDF